MLSSADIARIKKDIAALEKALASCSDSGIRKQITFWIEQQKERLARRL